MPQTPTAGCLLVDRHSILEVGMKKAAPELVEIWEEQEEWYSKAVQYWDKQEASVEGVLGGFGFVSEPDIADSLSLLLRVSHPTFYPYMGFILPSLGWLIMPAPLAVN